MAAHAMAPTCMAAPMVTIGLPALAARGTAAPLPMNPAMLKGSNIATPPGMLVIVVCRPGGRPGTSGAPLRSGRVSSSSAARRRRGGLARRPIAPRR